MFADLLKQPQEYEDGRYVDGGLAAQLGVLDRANGVALRATFIVDPNNVIQHVTVNNLDVGRNPEETLRILDALQTGELCPCNRAVGGATL
jgi:peroxiredoxin (alkyl hydroperoxide reductase subunit C)